VKWLNPTGSTQHTGDGCYGIVRATEANWIAYRFHQTTAEELGVKPTDEEARQLCEDDEPLRKRP
jgi:hypothetical protein